MTTYKLGDEIYEDSFLRLVAEDTEVPEALKLIRQCRNEARRARDEAKSPEFRPSIPGYLPAYGAESEVRAIVDYCRLKGIMQRSPYFRSLIVKKLDPNRWRAERQVDGMNIDDIDS
jgi:hypothetical protein